MAAPAIRGVLFDKDGTLIDFFATWAPAYEQAAQDTARGDAALAERLMTVGGWNPMTRRFRPDSPLAAGTNAEIGKLWAEAAGHADHRAFTAQLEKFFQDYTTANARPVTDLVNLFGRLRGHGLRLGLATMDSSAAAEAQLSAFGVRRLMDFVCGYDSGFGHKPGPGMVHEFCRIVGLPEKSIAVVGDSPHDLDMARSAGAGMAIGVLTGVSPREVLAIHADLVLESIADLETALELVA